MTEASGKTPIHLWIVGFISLLWNAIGGYDYTMTQMHNRAYIEAAMGPMGMSYEDAVAFFNSFPMWADALWALGVWGSVAGSVLLLLRSRYAVPAFLVSILGAVLSFSYQATLEWPPEMVISAAAKFMPVVIVVLVALQLWYARRQTKAGVLH